MSRALSLSRVSTILCLFVVCFAGCGGPAPVPVSGKIVLPSKTKLAETDTIVVVFNPEDPSSGAAENANVSAKDLTFTAKVLPGKYKVSVTVQPYAGTPDSQKRTKELASQFGGFSANSTPLKVEVTNDASQTITLDLEKKTAGK